ncbi:MAG: PD-(D/E)XK nuclease family transposase, partial [Saprospiraceae bacterium]
MQDLVFIDWKSDVGFKWLFARDTVKEYLLEFLKDLAVEVSGYSAFLEVNSLHKIRGLDYLNVERVFKVDLALRKILFDVYVELPNGQRVILEMQKSPHKGLYRRMLGYLLQGVEGSNEIPHVLIGLMNFKFSRSWGTFQGDSVIDIHRVFREGELITVEFGRFDKALEELETKFDCWLFLFKNITNLKVIPDIFRGTIFEKMMEMSRIKTLPGEKLEEWQQELMNNKYIQEAIEILAEQAVEEAVEQAAEEAFAKGREKGIAEAREEGISEKEEEVIDAFRKGEVKGFQ